MLAAEKLYVREQTPVYFNGPTDSRRAHLTLLTQVDNVTM